MSPLRIVSFILFVTFVTGLDFVDRKVIVAGPYEGSSLVQKLNTAYQYSDREVALSFTKTTGVTQAITLYEANRSDGLFLPGRLPPETAGSWVQLPIALYGMAVIYNTNPPAPPNPYGFFSDFVLDPTMMTAVWSGVVPSWQDPQMTASNEYAELPEGNITLVVQVFDTADDEFVSSTGLFGRYLASIDPHGFGTAYAAAGYNLSRTLEALNPGRVHHVASAAASPSSLATVLPTVPASMSYAAWADVVSAGRKYASLINYAGNFIPAPSTASLQSALEDFQTTLTTEGASLDLVNGPGIVSWPITGIFYATVKQQVTDRDCSYVADLLSLLAWTQTSGPIVDSSVSTTAVAPLTLGYSHIGLEAMADIRCDGSVVVSTAFLVGGGRPSQITPLWANAYDPPGQLLRLKFMDMSPGQSKDNVMDQDINFAVLDGEYEPISNATLVPIAYGAVVPAHNVPTLIGSPYTLSFSPRTIASVLLNLTHYWDDPYVIADNPSLPSWVFEHVPIVFVVDAGGSLDRSGGPAGGMANRALYTYLTERVAGFNASVWRPGGGVVYPIQGIPSACIQAGDAGVASVVASTPYSIGFDVLASILRQRTIPVASLDGLAPSIEVIQAAARSRLGLLQARQTTSVWPIVFQQQMLIKTNRPSGCNSLSNLLEWVYWTQSNGSTAETIAKDAGVVTQGSLSVNQTQKLALTLARITCVGAVAFQRVSCMDPVDGVICSGLGTCVVPPATSSDNTAYCACPSSRTGALCETIVESQGPAKGSDDTVALGVGIGVGAAVAVLAILLLVCMACFLAALWAFGSPFNRGRREWEIDFKELEIGEQIGMGGNSVVHKAKWRGTEVAVKTFANSHLLSKEDRARLCDEIDITSAMRHPNIVLFLAACTKTSQMCLVMQYMNLGSLFDLLHNDLILALPFKWRLTKAAKYIAEGMRFLHASGIVHRDLKSLNVLMDSSWNVKVADFGLSTTKKTIGSYEHQQMSVPWCAPEVLREVEGADGMLADVYSYGIVLWELFTRRMPYAPEDPDAMMPSRSAIAVAVLRDEARPELPDDGSLHELLDLCDMAHSDTIVQVVDLMRKCWSTEPTERPMFDAIFKHLEVIEAQCALSGSHLEDVTSLASHGGGSSSASQRSNSLRRRSVPPMYKTSALAPVASAFSAPDGPLSVVFCDLPYAGRVWETRPNVARQATVLYNAALRSSLAACNGFEALLPTEKGVADPTTTGIGTFFFVFRHVGDAIRWCCEAQKLLLEVSWPSELIKIEGSHLEYATNDRGEDVIIYRGLRSRMGISWGACRKLLDERTRRVTYTGQATQSAAAITKLADGGQILMTADAMAEFDIECETMPLPEPEIVRLRLLRTEPALSTGDDDEDDDNDFGNIYQIVPQNLSGRKKDMVRWTAPSSGSSCTGTQVVAFDDDALVEMSLEREKDEPSLCQMASANDCRWFVRSGDLVVGKEVGRGTTASVHSAHWKGTPVAVKMFNKMSINEDQLLDHRCEVALMSGLRHLNVLLFIGACFFDNRLVLVTEFMKNGSLRDVLRNTAAYPLAWKQKLRFALDIARGLAYLHQLSPPVLHRDLKSSNLLVDSDMTVKLADFGFSRLKQDNQTRATRCGTPAWNAPEVMQGKPHDEKSDIYSLGIVLWEIYTRRLPYAESNFMRVTMDVIAGRRPDISSDCPVQYKELVKACWSPDPALRPSAEIVMERIIEMMGEDAEGTSPFFV